MNNKQLKTYTCHFCGLPSRAVDVMIAGPGGVCICSDCIEALALQVDAKRVSMDKVRGG